jgi:hypothetical protein
MSSDQPPRLPGDVWPRPEPNQCVVCGPWPAELRAVMRKAIEAIPLRKDVCDDCLKALWDTLPKGPPTSDP